MVPPIIFYLALLVIPALLLLINLQKKKKEEKVTKKKKMILPPSGPLRLPIIGHLYLLKKPLHLALLPLRDRYGPIVFLKFGSRPVLLVSSLALAEECFTKNDLAFASRAQLPLAKYLNYDYTTVGAAPYGDHWRNIRRLVTSEVLSPHRLNSFADLRASEVRLMVAEIYRRSSAGPAEVELKSRLFGLTLNLMMRMVEGKRYYGEEVDDLHAAKKFMEVIEETFTFLGASNISDFVPILQLFDVGTRRKLKWLEKVMDDFLQNMIEKKRKELGASSGSAAAASSSPSGKGTMIDVILSLQKSDPAYYSDKIIKALIITLLSAGTDTTSDTIEWSMSLLLNNPEILKKAKAELASKEELKTRLLRESDVPDLPYLNAIILESLRLYPAGPLLVPHHSTADCVVGGYDVPAGTMLIVNAYAIHRDPAVWPEHPADEFIPERFLQQSTGGAVAGADDGEHRIHRRPTNTMLPFGMGRRRCPGEAHANRVMHLALGTLIQCFDWKAPPPGHVDMEEGQGLSLPKKNPLRAICSPEPHMLHLLQTL